MCQVKEGSGEGGYNTPGGNGGSPERKRLRERRIIAAGGAFFRDQSLKVAARKKRGARRFSTPEGKKLREKKRKGSCLGSR